MKVPFFGRVGLQPVKAFETKDGGVDVHAMNMKTGKFSRDMGLADEIYNGPQYNVTEMSERDFGTYVVSIKRKRGIDCSVDPAGV